MKSWTEGIIQQWKTDSIPLNKGALIEMIAETETALGFRFPGEFTELYLQTDGFAHRELPGSGYVIWPIHRILHEFRKSDNKNFIGFADFPGHRQTIGFLKNKKGIFKNSDQQSSFADTFREGIQWMNKNTSLLH